MFCFVQTLSFFLFFSRLERNIVRNVANGSRTDGEYKCRGITFMDKSFNRNSIVKVVATSFLIIEAVSNDCSTFQEHGQTT
jgi:hypothetical protein